MDSWIIFVIGLAVGGAFAGQFYYLQHQTITLHNRLRKIEATSQPIQESTSENDTASRIRDSLFQIINDALLVIEVEGMHVLTANPMAAALLGVDPAGKALLDACDCPELSEFVRQAGAFSGEIPEVLLEVAGNLMRARVLLVPDLAEPVYLLLLRDETRLQRLGRARSEMIANISHELRTPVATIGLLADTLLAGALKKAKRSVKLTREIRREADTLTQLVQEMHDLSLIESGHMPLKLMPLDLSDLIRGSVEPLLPLAERKNQTITIEELLPVSVLADVTQIQRAIKNIVHNAIKFAPKSGHVRLWVRQEGEEITLAISNDGDPIPENELPRIFERFYQVDRARSQGTGLGLAITRHIVLSHGGRLWAQNNTPAPGVTFFFTLPQA